MDVDMDTKGSLMMRTKGGNNDESCWCRDSDSNPDVDDEMNTE